MRKLLNSRWRAAVLIAACLSIVTSVAIHPRAAAPVSISQNFDAIGTSATATLPADFKVDKPTQARTVGTYAAAVTATTQRGGNSLSTTATNGIYNFGAGDPATATDRAVGFLSSGSATQSGNLYFRFANTGDAALANLPVSYNVEKYRNGTNSAGFRIQLFYSYDGIVWTSAGATFFTAFTPDTGGNSGFNSAPGATVAVTGQLTPAQPIAVGANFYLAWNYSVTSGGTYTNAQALAVDDIVIGGSTPPPSSTPPTATGAASPATVAAGGPTLVTVNVTPGANPVSAGLSVVANLSSIGGSATQAFFDDHTHGDATASDNVFSFFATVPVSTPAGAKTLTATITDAQARTATATIALTVDLPPPTTVAIDEIQGPGTESPLKGQRVSTTGIVTGVKSSGFFIQAAQPGDSDPQTSESVFVYTGSALPPAAAVGNLVTVIGTVQEYWSLTELSGTVSVTLVSTGNALPAAVTLPAPTATGGLSQLEPYEGMRVKVDSLTVVAPTDYGMFYGVMPGTDRPFREPGLDPSAPAIADMPAGVPRFDGNPERIGVDGGAIGAHVIEVTTHAVVSNITGPLDYASGAYVIDAEATPTFTGNMSPVPVPDATPGQFTVASWNMLNFTSDPTRLTKASRVIREVMGMPDIIGVEEVGSLATLQDLAFRISSDAGSSSPGYVAYLVPVNTTQNIGFLVKQTVSVTSVTQVGADATFVDPKDGSIDTLNDRPPLVLRASILDSRGGPAFPVTVVVNHLRSLISVDANTPDGLYARTKRRLGAEYLANMLQQYRQSGEHVVSVGDYNAFQFNDGYVDVIGTIVGAPTPDTQVLYASPDLVDPNFTDLIDFAPPAERYSYVENGNAQAIDHAIVSPNMLPRFGALAFGRINADFPYSYTTDATRPERASDHDPVVAYFTFPTADLSVTASAAPANPVLTGSTLTYTIAASNGANDDATGVTMTAGLPAGLTGVTTTAPDGWNCDTTSTAVSCTAGVLKANTDAVFTVAGTVDCLLPDGNLSSQVSIDSTMYDPDPANNTSTVVTTVSNPAPVISGESITPAALWPVNHKMVPVSIDYSIADNCGPAPACSLTVSSNEPGDGRGDGRTATDWQVIDGHNLLLRAERSGTGSGRTYTIGITCTDSSGKPGTKNVFVTVPKSQK